MMKQAIQDFAKQFAWNPQIENSHKLKHYKKFVVAGMGGSGHAADLIKSWNPQLDIVTHRNYGLPSIISHEHLVIASSYSGNTEETIDALARAIKNKFSCAVIATGGKLLTQAKKYQIPYIQIPDTGIQPRSALGFSFKGLLKLIGDDKGLASVGKLAKLLKPNASENNGKALSLKLKNKVPVIYAGVQNQALANIWKITLNETGKIPAFYNVLPELNHNEMNGFDRAPTSKHLSEGFYFIMLKDHYDHPRVQKRMRVLEQLYVKRGLPVEIISLSNKIRRSLPSFALRATEGPPDINPRLKPWYSAEADKDWFLRTFSAITLAGWTAFYTAEMYGNDSEQVPMVEEFKRLIAK